MDILQGKKTILTLVVMAIYNVALPLLGIKEITADALDITVNTILLIAAAIFRLIARPKA